MPATTRTATSPPKQARGFALFRVLRYDAVRSRNVYLRGCLRFSDSGLFFQHFRCPMQPMQRYNPVHLLAGQHLHRSRHLAVVHSQPKSSRRYWHGKICSRCSFKTR